MIITLGSFQLAPGGDASPEELRVNGLTKVQVAEYLRAANAIPFARGNAVNTLTFATTREWPDYGSAMAYLITHRATVPSSGVLKVVSEPQETTVISFSAAIAVLESDEGTIQGIVTRHQYKVVCGPLTGGSLGLTS